VDAVVSTIGGSVADPSADSTGNINIIEAAAKKGVKKFVLVGPLVLMGGAPATHGTQRSSVPMRLGAHAPAFSLFALLQVTSIGCGDSKDAPGEKVYEVLKPVLLEKDKAEEALKVGKDA
jgi:hypothetical protein